jgi:low affinity Fe/Cu permease
MDRTEAAESRKKDDGRDPFEKFVEAANQLVSRGPFFLIMVAVLVAWAASYPLWSSATKWELTLHTGSAILSLLLLALLENAGRRSQEAIQEKLNVLAEALADLMTSRAADDPELEESVEKLRQAIGLEDRH